MEGELAEARAAAEDAEAAAAQLEALRRIEAAARAAAAAEHQARAAPPASPGTPCRALPCARAAPPAAAGACMQAPVRVLARLRGGDQCAPLGYVAKDEGIWYRVYERQWPAARRTSWRRWRRSARTRRRRWRSRARGPAAACCAGWLARATCRRRARVRTMRWCHPRPG